MHTELNIAKMFSSYTGLSSFLKRFPREFYAKNSIVCESHMILTRRQSGQVDDDNILWTTPELHFKLHVLKGRESKCRQTKWRQYKEAARILNIEQRRAIIDEALLLIDAEF